MAQGKTPSDIEAEIVRSRKQLAITLDEIAVRVHPKTVMDEAREKVAERVDNTVGQAYVAVNRTVSRARGQVIAPDGSPRMERIVPLALVTVAVLGLVSVTARRRRD